MSNLTSRDYRFRFSNPIGGRLGEMPYIEIRVGEEIPPLSKAYLICVDIHYSKKPATSRLGVVWAVSGTEVMLKLYCQADDIRLKKQYQTDSSLAEKIIAILTLPEERGKTGDSYRRIETKTTVPKEELPEFLRPLATQVEKWKAFFRQPAMEELQGHHDVSVNEEGYYLAYISRGCFRPKPPYEEIEGLSPERLKSFYKFYPVYTRGFDFKPQTEPPTVLDDAVYWELREPKILVILPHDSSCEGFALRYGYLDFFRAYIKTKEERQVEFSKFCEADRAVKEAEEVEKSRLQVEAVRQALLSP